MKRLIQLSIIVLVLSLVALAGATSLVPPPKFTALDSNGDPQVGAFLYTYETGTTTPKTTWTDSTKVTPNPNPIILDSYGQANVWIDSSGGAYRLKLLDSDGNTVWTVDGVEDLSPENFLGAAYYPDADAADQGVAGDSNTIKYYADAVGANNATIVLRHNSGAATTEYTVASDLDLSSSSGIQFEIERGAVLSINSGTTLTIYSPENILAAPNQQIFDCDEDGVRFTKAGTVHPMWWGAVVDGHVTNPSVNATDDSVAWQAAFDSLADVTDTPGVDGGTVQAPFGSSYIETGIIWPNDGTDCNRIRLVGHNSTGGSGGVSKVSVIRYGDTPGAAIDLKNGDDSNLNWAGSIENIALEQTGARDPGTFGIKAYQIRGGMIDNVEINRFGSYGIYVYSYAYYAHIRNLKCYNNTKGARFGNLNGVKFDSCAFSKNEEEGLLINYGGYGINLDSCYFESNGEYGLDARYISQISLNNCYFESNGSDLATPSHIFVRGDSFYATQVNLNNNHFSKTHLCFSIYLFNVAQISFIGNYFGSTFSNQPFGITEGYPKGFMANNRWNHISNIPSIVYQGSVFTTDDYFPSIKLIGKTGDYLDAMNAGTVFFNYTAYNAGGSVGYICNKSGKGRYASDVTGVTASTTSGSDIIDVSDYTLLPRGKTIMVEDGAGGYVEFGANNDTRVTVRDVTGSGSTSQLRVSEEANSTVTDQVLSTPSASLDYIGGRIFIKSTDHHTVTGTTDETTLQSFTIPNGILDWQSSGSGANLKIFISGNKINQYGDKLIKLYIGDTPIVINNSRDADTITIDSITSANPAVVTSTAHGLKPGDKISILAGTLTEMTELNGAGYTIFNVTDNTFQLFEVGTDTVVDSSTYAAETTGGSGVKVNNPNPWIFEGYLSFQGTDDLVLSWRGYDRSNTMMGVEQISETTGADLDIEVTATLEHASDTVSMDLFTVEGR